MNKRALSTMEIIIGFVIVFAVVFIVFTVGRDLVGNVFTQIKSALGF